MDLLRLQTRLAFVLRPFAALYRLGATLRRRIWESGYCNRLNPTCPCISVGNIAWGGTGKTPLTDWLLTWAEARKLRPVVLSRGYKADVRLSSIYVKHHHRAREVGDEPLMLAQDHPDAAILVDPDRKRSGRYALRCLSPDLFILDDGFQHLSLRRDLDLVLLRPEDLTTEWNRLIPAGSWRESAEALSRADAFLIKCDRAGMERLLPAIRARLERFKRPVFSFGLRPVRLEPVGTRNHPEDLRRKPYALATGIGNPVLVRETVSAFLGHPPDEEFFFPDHHAYGFRDVERITKSGLPVVCTRKDAVKLRELSPANMWSLRVETRFGPSLWAGMSFPSWFDEWWRVRQEKRIEQLGPRDSKWTGFVADAGLWEATPPEAQETAPEIMPEDTEKGTPEAPPEVTEDAPATPEAASETAAVPEAATTVAEGEPSKAPDPSTPSESAAEGATAQTNAPAPAAATAGEYPQQEDHPETADTPKADGASPASGTEPAAAIPPTGVAPATPRA